jgi:hypothetical protein
MPRSQSSGSRRYLTVIQDERGYRRNRRAAWHFLSDHGAPTWLWTRLVRSTWRRCSTCGLRGVGRWKQAATFGGGLPPRHYCGPTCDREWF